MLALLVALIALVAAARAAEAQVQVHVDIGFHLPAPPRLVVVPQVPAVRYVPAPAAPGNLFFYNGQYWVFSAGGWYVSGGYNGPWIAVAPQFVPRPVLLVPVQYYHVPPSPWRTWERARAPHWKEEWGPEWDFQDPHLSLAQIHAAFARSCNHQATLDVASPVL